MPLHGITIAERVAGFAAGIDALRGVPSSVIGDVMGRLTGTTALRPVHRSPLAVCGNAVTVRVRAGDNLLIHRALDMLQPGDVLLVDGEGDVSRALVGEIMMTSARVKGAVAFVMDGAVRDVDAFEEHRFPCWARGISLRGPYKDGPGEINGAIAIDGMVIEPGDLIIGDADGLLCVPYAEVDAIAAAAEAKGAAEQKTLAEIAEGRLDTSWVDAALKRIGCNIEPR